MTYNNSVYTPPPTLAEVASSPFPIEVPLHTNPQAEVVNNIGTTHIPGEINPAEGSSRRKRKIVSDNTTKEERNNLVVNYNAHKNFPESIFQSDYNLFRTLGIDPKEPVSLDDETKEATFTIFRLKRIKLTRICYFHSCGYVAARTKPIDILDHYAKKHFNFVDIECPMHRERVFNLSIYKHIRENHTNLDKQQSRELANDLIKKRYPNDHLFSEESICRSSQQNSTNANLGIDNDFPSTSFLGIPAPPHTNPTPITESLPVTPCLSDSILEDPEDEIFKKIEKQFEKALKNLEPEQYRAFLLRVHLQITDQIISQLSSHPNFNQ